MYKINVFDDTPVHNCQLPSITCAFSKVPSRLTSVLNWTCFRLIVIYPKWGVDLPTQNTSECHTPGLFPHDCSRDKYEK